MKISFIEQKQHNNSLYCIWNLTDTIRKISEKTTLTINTEVQLC